MNPPIFTIKKKDNRSRCLAVESRGCGNGAYQSIPKEGLVPIIARSTKQKGAPGAGIAIGKKGGVGPSGRPRGVAIVNTQCLTRSIACRIAVDAQSYRSLHQLSPIPFKEFKAGRTFPLASALIVIGPKFAWHGSRCVWPISRVGVRS